MTRILIIGQSRTTCALLILLAMAEVSRFHNDSGRSYDVRGIAPSVGKSRKGKGQRKANRARAERWR